MPGFPARPCVGRFEEGNPVAEDKLNLKAMEEAESKDDLGRFRPLRGLWYVIFMVFTVTGVVLAINQIFTLKLFLNIVFLDNSFLYLIVGLYMSMVYLIFPATSKSPRDRVPWYDALLFLAVVALCGFFSWTGLQNIQEAWEFVAPDYAVWFAVLMWGLTLEAVRRAGGTAIFIIFGVLSTYPIFADWMPPMLAGMPQSFLGTARYHLMSEESVLGIPMQVFGTLIVGFIIFGVTLQSTGGGRFFINLAFAMLGGVRGGPAKVAIVASGMFGSLSGSVITNVLTTGAMTIPAMKRTGYPARYAGGIEACASTGGVLMPPVMGATAFVMASFLGVSYITVAIAAVIPSLLYFYGLFVQIDAYAARNNIHGLPKEELPKVFTTLKEGWYYVFAFFLLIYLLVYLHRESHAPFYATGVLLLLSQIRTDTRMDLKKFLAFLESIGKLLAELVAVLAAVGLIIGGLMMTGMAGTFSGDLVRLAGGNVPLLLLLGALTSFILGIGMTVTAAYIFLAIVLAPALVDLGLDKVAVHLFILYWGMISFITPPVALGAYAAASLAGSKPIETGFEAMRLGSIIYFLPFFFVLNPALIFHAGPLDVIMELGTALLGITLVASGLQGYLVKVGKLETSWPALFTRGLLIAGGLLLAYPEMITNVVGVVVVLPAILIGKRINLPSLVTDSPGAK